MTSSLEILFLLKFRKQDNNIDARSSLIKIVIEAFVLDRFSLYLLSFPDMHISDATKIIDLAYI